jgi:hypothetical protein
MEYLLTLLVGAYILYVGIKLLDKDQAWSWREKSARQQGVKVERTPEWEAATNNGAYLFISIAVVLMVGGLLGAIITFLPGTSVESDSMTSIYTINGRELTPEESRQFEEDGGTSYYKKYPPRP